MNEHFGAIFLKTNMENPKRDVGKIGKARYSENKRVK